MDTQAEKHATLKEIVEREGANRKCADCGMVRPQWASTTFGIFICLNCAGMHRSFGIKISIVKSVGMDQWTQADIKRMEVGGNARFAAEIERLGLQKTEKSVLYKEKRIRDYAAEIEKEVHKIWPEQKDKGSTQNRSTARKSPSTLDASHTSHRARTQPLSSSYTSAYATRDSLPSMDAIQTNISSVLGRAAEYLYTGASALNEKVIGPGSTLIKEKTTQITEYIKGTEAKKHEHRKSIHKKDARKRDTDTKWD